MKKIGSCALLNAFKNTGIQKIPLITFGFERRLIYFGPSHSIHSGGMSQRRYDIFPGSLKAHSDERDRAEKIAELRELGVGMGRARARLAQLGKRFWRRGRFM